MSTLEMTQQVPQEVLERHSLDHANVIIRIHNPSEASEELLREARELARDFGTNVIEYVDDNIHYFVSY